jgi:hypothetical protein
LPFGNHHLLMNVAVCGAPGELAARRIKHVGDVYRERGRVPAQCRENGAPVEKRRRIAQAIAQTRLALQLQARGIGLLEQLRHPGTGDSAPGRKRFTGMDLAVG